MTVPVPDPADRSDVEKRPPPTVDRATLDRIFGTEPQSTRDDLPDPEIPTSRDDWYQENRPPHHEG
jgi:hypothetical protein